MCMNIQEILIWQVLCSRQKNFIDRPPSNKQIGDIKLFIGLGIVLNDYNFFFTTKIQKFKEICMSYFREHLSGVYTNFI